MPPKRGAKRKANSHQNGDANGSNELSVPDRATWPGWVEMESEPAFFNVMLGEMGVQGAKVQEVYSLDDEMLAILPQPVHALIFLFKYRDADAQQTETSCPKHIWFANQVPDFACATIALLNIVNNIQDLDVGKELRDFKCLTASMTPYQRGEAIDDFKFVRTIHNSFAREVDILNADIYLRNRAVRAKKRIAAQKAAENRKAKLQSQEALATEAQNTASSTNGRPVANQAKKRDSVSSSTPTRSQRSVRGSGDPVARPSGPASDSSDGEYHQGSAKTSAKSKTAPNGTLDGANSPTNATRRSSRKRPTPKSPYAERVARHSPDATEDDGFHFMAYMPIGDRVWKLDGMESFPQDLGPFSPDLIGGWLSIAQPALQARMMQYEASEIQFNLMAVCRDGLPADRAALARNVVALRTVDAKLDRACGGWREIEGAETPSATVLGPSVEYGITDSDISTASAARSSPSPSPSSSSSSSSSPAGEDKPDRNMFRKIEAEQDLLELVSLRREIIGQQGGLRAAVRDGMLADLDDGEKARQRRHDYGGFVKAWLGALAEREELTGLIEGLV